MARQLAGGFLYTMKWYIYALYNKETNKIYIGETSNVQRRVSEHNKKLGNHYTAKIKGDWKLIYKEEAEDRTNALIREKQLKSYRGRQFIKQFIPAWRNGSAASC